MVRPPCGRCLAAAALALAVTSLGLSARGAAPQILLLDFWSPQCGPCMQMKPIMHSFEQANYPIREIDTTRDFQTSQQFGVSRIPCFVMLVDGQEVDREIGYTSSERLQQMFEKAKEIVVQRHHARGQSPDALTQPGVVAGGNTAQGPAPRLETATSVQQQNWSQTAAATSPGGPTCPVQSPVETAAGSSSSDDFPPNLMAATVRIRVDDPQGRSFGTGTIVDARSGEALIVTCGHLFRESKGKGQMTVETFDVGPSGPQVSETLPGQLISYDLQRDVAFVSIKPTQQVAVVPVAPDHTAIQRGDRVATIGCSNGKNPTLLPQRINQLDRYQGPANIEVSGAPEEGRSGGGLFNLQGQLIGVCYAADYEGKEGLYAALGSVHEELARLGLKDVYARNDTAPQVGATASDSKVGQPLIRLQEPRDPITPLPGQTVSAAADSKAALPQSLSEPEQAAFGEIMQRATSSEVVVIVRPKTPGGQSEVITLDSVTPEFVQALKSHERGSQAAVTR